MAPHRNTQPYLLMGTVTPATRFLIVWILRLRTCIHSQTTSTTTPLLAYILPRINIRPCHHLHSRSAGFLRLEKRTAFLLDDTLLKSTEGFYGLIILRPIFVPVKQGSWTEAQHFLYLILVLSPSVPKGGAGKLGGGYTTNDPPPQPTNPQGLDAEPAAP